ncbi:MAG: hypothetical protein AB7Y46_00915 [Armatimonadota bacterium]
MHLHKLPAAVVVLGLIAALACPALGQRVDLDVLANIGQDNSLYFEGTVTALDLTPRGHLQVRNEIDVSVEHITANGEFRTLPDTWNSASDEARKGNRLLSAQERQGVESTLVSIAGQAVEASDDGYPFLVSGTVDLTGADRFRIIATLRHTWAGSWPAADCRYSIAGPFKVKPGIARKRRGGGMLGDIGRFLERSVGDVTDVMVDNADLLLGGALSPVGLLQQVLMGEVQQRHHALGAALQYIGRAAGLDAGMVTMDQTFTDPGADPYQSQDLTQALVGDLAQRVLGETSSSGAQPAVAADPTAPTPVGDFDQAAALLKSDLEQQVGLRDLTVTVDATTVVVTSAAPALQGYGHLESIIAYILVDAALAAPWVQQVVALFADETGGTYGMQAPASAALQYAQGTMDTATFLSMCTLTDASGLAAGPTAQTAYDPAATTQPPTATEPGTPPAPTALPAPILPIAVAAEAAAPTVVSQAQLPPGWLTSPTREVTPAELQQVLPAAQLSDHMITWSGMQVLQVGQVATTLVAMQLPSAQEASALLQHISTQYGGTPSAAGTLRLASQPPVDLLQTDTMVHLLQGDPQTVAQVAGLLHTLTGTTPTAAEPGLTPIAAQPAAEPTAEPTATPTTEPAAEPATPPATEPAAQPATEPGAAPTSQPTEPTTPAPTATTEPAPTTVEPEPEPEPPPAPIELPVGSFVSQARLCTGVDEDGKPETFYGTVPAGAQRVGLYLAFRDAPANSEVMIAWYRDGQVLSRRLLVVTGDRRTVNYIMPAGAEGFPSGQYWVEIITGEEPLARLLFDAP